MSKSNPVLGDPFVYVGSNQDFFTAGKTYRVGRCDAGGVSFQDDRGTLHRISFEFLAQNFTG